MGMMRFGYRSDYLQSTDVTICFPSGKLTTREPAPAPAAPVQTDPSQKGGAVRPPDPPKYQYKDGMKLQVIWFLHGGGDDDTTMYRMTSLERYAEENCVVLVSPQCGNSYFNNSVTGARWADHFIKELRPMISAILPISDRREDNFIMGFAMGGNAALGLAMMFPEVFDAVVDLSGGIGLTMDREEYIAQLSWMGGKMKYTFRDEDSFIGSDHDLYYLAERNIKEGRPLPKVYIGVGENDFIQYRVKRDAELFRELGYDTYYEEGKDLAHEWDFWDLYFAKALYEWLPLKRAPIYAE